ncbi:hypothetical protein NDU88_005454 [Pleurodeles waltl]|uniref:Uncharacterized protein n=1 Tax=Pleurodeles waltl TaxID=8319 RepID=A0AAV7RK76_PLEWA|nr:hypothetical protein NDU88_005454 [Pleurodeles waltl]
MQQAARTEGDAGTASRGQAGRLPAAAVHRAYWALPGHPVATDCLAWMLSFRCRVIREDELRSVLPLPAALSARQGGGRGTGASVPGRHGMAGREGVPAAQPSHGTCSSAAL